MGAVQDIDKGWNNFVKQAEYFVKHEVVFGWIDGSKDRKDGEALNNATIATIHEYGSEDGRIPEGRLGLRAWVDSHQDDIGKRIEAAYKNAIPKGNAERELNKVGLWATAAWRKWQRDTQPGPELSQATLDLKIAKHGEATIAGNKKLADTGQLLGGVTHLIRRRGETKDL